MVTDGDVAGEVAARWVPVLPAVLMVDGGRTRRWWTGFTLAAGAKCSRDTSRSCFRHSGTLPRACAVLPRRRLGVRANETFP